MKTAEEVFNKIFDIPTGELPCGISFIKFKIKIINAMEEYASQFREISEISDEEINKMATEGEIKHPTLKYYEGFYDGAKWYRNQLRKPNHVTMHYLKVADKELPINEYLLDE